MKGHLKITHKNNLTGEEVKVYDQKQTISDAGLQLLLYSISNEAGFFDESGQFQETDGSYFYGLTLGDDFGSGTPSKPEPETNEYSQEDHNEVYVFEQSEITRTYPDNKSVKMEVSLDGSVLVPADYADTGYFTYSSAAMRLFNGEVIAGKRFKSVAIDVHTTMTLEWTITFNR